MTSPAHISVMPVEVMQMIALPPGGIAVDATLGMGGHAQLMADVLGNSGHLIGIDRDRASLAKAKERLSSLNLKIDLLAGSFNEIDRLIASVGVAAVDGILMDLGISSVQLDDGERGFAFSNDGPLDMRMDGSQGKTAADIVNEWPASELEKIFWEYSQERFSKRFAQAIITARAVKRITTTKQLADLLLRALPKSYQRGRIHPATRSFQALRIAVNDELNVLSTGISKAFDCLKPGGRLVVIAFHSLEDRIVKNFFKQLQVEGRATVLVKRPLVPTEEECAVNSRSRSAKLRGLQKTNT